MLKLRAPNVVWAHGASHSHWVPPVVSVAVVIYE